MIHFHGFAQNNNTTKFSYQAKECVTFDKSTSRK